MDSNELKSSGIINTRDFWDFSGTDWGSKFIGIAKTLALMHT